MTLPRTVRLCDTIELEALRHRQHLSLADLGRILFRGTDIYDDSSDLDSVNWIKEALSLAARRKEVCASYPFDISQNTIKPYPQSSKNPYVAMLIGWGVCKSGRSFSDRTVASDFRKYFEDLVKAALISAGCRAEVLSVPREFRGLPKELKPALREISKRFGNFGDVCDEKLSGHDNDLGVDVVATPFLKNGGRHSWPAFLVQCSTGPVSNLQAKLQEGDGTFSGVWKSGFKKSHCIQSVATPYDLLDLSVVHWDRLSDAGWVLDRTRIADLCSRAAPLDAPARFFEFLPRLDQALNQLDTATLLGDS